MAALLSAGAWLRETAILGGEARARSRRPLLDEAASAGQDSEIAVFAGGCFWGVQGVFQHVEGVTNAVSGYAGGESRTAQYEIVGSGTTGHAESVQITFDPHKISYGRILQIYFSVAHDPTQLNRQGPDTGTQYRSTIFPDERRAGAGREGLYRPARPGARLPGGHRHHDRARPAPSIRPRPIIRIS